MKQLIDIKDISIVVQGQVALAHYPGTNTPWTKKLFQQLRILLPNAKLILSTWDNTIVEGIDFDEVIFNSDPGAYLYDEQLVIPNNTNRQLISTQAGLKKVNTLYVLKLRTDSMITSLEFLNHFGKYSFRKKQYSVFQERVLACAMYAKRFASSRKHKINQIFQISDLVLFGYTSDIMNLFSAPLQKEPESSQYFKFNSKPSEDAYSTMLARFTPEQYLWFSLIEKNLDISCDNRLDYDDDLLELSHESLMNNFVFLDQIHWGLSIRGHITQPKLSPWVWDGLYHYAYWHNEYNKASGTSTICLPTRTQILRIVFFYSWLPSIFFHELKKLIHKIWRAINMTKLKYICRKISLSNIGIYTKHLYLKFSTRFPQAQKIARQKTIPEKMNSIGHALPYIGQYDCLSFDIFDTLISRAIHPVWVPLAQTGSTAELMLLQIGIKINSEVFNNKRDKAIADIYAENKLKGLDSEYQIREVFCRIFSEIGVKKDQINDLADALAKNERERELKTLFVKPKVLEFLAECKKQNKKIIAISDMYFSKKDINFILKSLGIDSFFSHIFVSSEYTVTKHSGFLFDHVLKEIDMRPKNILHFGDNQCSDVMAARRRGIDSIWIYDPLVHGRKEIISQYYLGKRPITSLIKTEFIKLNKYNKKDIFSGLIRENLAPDLCNFVFTMLHDLYLEGISSVFFLERDGTLFYELATKLNKQIALFYNMHPITLARVRISRRRSACLNDLSSPELFIERAIRGGALTNRFSVIEVLGSFSIQITDLPTNIQQQLPLKDSSRLWFNEIYTKSILPVVQKKCSDFLTELKELGIFNSQKIAVCDVGWAGTIQKDLAACISANNYKTQLFGYYYGTDDRALEIDSFYPVTQYKAGYHKGESILGAYSAVEFFIKDYSSKREESVAQLGESTVKLNEHSRSTILNYADDFAETVNKWGFFPDQIAEFTKEKATLFFTRPPRKLLPYLEQIKFSLDRHDCDTALPIAPKMRLYRVFTDNRKINTLSQWKQGAWRRSGGYFLDWMR